MSTCFTCNKALGVGKIMKASGKSYHADCFQCEWCKSPLVLETYYSIDSHNVCQSCRNKERCVKCGFLITETKYVVVDNKTWHEDCFRCVKCLKILIKFHFKGEELFCTDCLCKEEAGAEDCGKCGYPLDGSVVKAVGKRYHEDCFVCHNCLGPFEDDVFINIKGNPHCETCSNDPAVLGIDQLSLNDSKKPSGPATAASASGAAASTSGAGSKYGSSTGASPASSSGAGAGSRSGSDSSAGAGSRSGLGSGSGSSSGVDKAGPESKPASVSGSGSGADKAGAGSKFGPGSGAGAGAGSKYGPGSGAGSNSGSAQSASGGGDDEVVIVEENKFLNPANLPPRGESKFDGPKKKKFATKLETEDKKRDFKTKAALGFSAQSDHLKDLETLGYKK